MSPELETLDQLTGDDLPLSVILRLYPDAVAFRQGVLGLITTGDVRLLTNDGMGVPAWRYRELFDDGIVMQELERLRLTITHQGAGRVT
jgi:hypothetical protein